MGIKFHCPNGHKLNVKAFLAGKRGICPKCHVRMRIPMESESEVGARVVATESPKKVHVQAGGNGRTGSVTAIQDNEIQSLLDDPERTWHISATDGSQLGPASGTELLGWLATDRIGSSSHVWCDSWEDWRPAIDVFPQLSANNFNHADTPDDVMAGLEDDPFSNINPMYLNNVTADVVIDRADANPFSGLIQPDPESTRVAAHRRSKRDAKPSYTKAIVLGLVALLSLAGLGFIFITAFSS